LDKLLRESGVDFKKVNYYIEPLSEEKLKELLKKMNLRPRDIMRTGEKVYKELELDEGKHTDAELIKLMVQNPDLIQRPIIERGPRAVLGRPTENVKELLK
jgi:arsenate reductase